MRRWSVVAPVLAVALLIGCGDEGAPSPSAAVEQFHQALAEGDAEAMCEVLSAAARAELETRGLTCEDPGALGDRLEAAAESGVEEVEVIGEDVEGGRATVSVQAGEAVTTYRLVQEDGAWRIEAPGTTGSATTDDGATDLEGAEEACDIERATVETAVEAFRSAEGDDPSSIEDLLDVGLLVDPPTGMDVVPGGAVIAVGACA